MPDLLPLDLLRLSQSNDGPKDLANHSGLVVLNCPISSIDLLRRVWHNTSYRVAADGGANRLHDIVQSHHNSCDYKIRDLLPDEIHGDLDSLRPDVRKIYEGHGVPITLDADQYHTDLEKAINKVLDHFKVQQLRQQQLQQQQQQQQQQVGAGGGSVVEVDIIILGSLSGRVDQGIGLLSELQRQHVRHATTAAATTATTTATIKARFWLISESSITFVLSAGTTTIDVSDRHAICTDNVGILPLYGATRISLSGFEWDVKSWLTEMGAAVSTSNHIRADDRVVVETERPVLFTIERRTDG